MLRIERPTSLIVAGLVVGLTMVAGGFFWANRAEQSYAEERADKEAQWVAYYNAAKASVRSLDKDGLIGANKDAVEAVNRKIPLFATWQLVPSAVRMMMGSDCIQATGDNEKDWLQDWTLNTQVINECKSQQNVGQKGIRGEIALVVASSAEDAQWFNKEETLYDDRTFASLIEIAEGTRLYANSADFRDKVARAKELIEGGYAMALNLVSVLSASVYQYSTSTSAFSSKIDGLLGAINNSTSDAGAVNFTEEYGDQLLGGNTEHSLYSDYYFARQFATPMANRVFIGPYGSTSGGISDKDNALERYARLVASAKMIDPAFYVDGYEEAPATETRTEVETVSIPFESTVMKDDSLPIGETRIVTEGVDGRKEITYEVTYVDGIETARRKVSERVTVESVTKVVAEGTYITPGTGEPDDPNDPIERPPEDPNDTNSGETGGVNNPGQGTNSSDGMVSAERLGGSKEVTAPDTGTEDQMESSANIVQVALSVVGLLAVLVGVTVVVKRYVFSPLKRR